MIGRTIAHYQILEKLGEGGMGVVWKARDTHLDRFVAIKVLPAEKVADPERKRRFVQEAKAASALDHPNIITIYDISSDKGVDFIAMEYVAGKTLVQLIPPNGMPSGEALKCAVEMADALARAHSAGIIHRDLKPSNIMVDEHGLVKLLDFGLAKLTEPAPLGEAVEAETETAGEPSLTKTGTILGTPAYMSPEQIEGKKLDARSDVFSFGAVLYEMLAGQRAFRGDSRISIMSAILRDTPPPLKTVRPDIPVELNRILFRCLEKNREARYRSGADLHKELAACQWQLAAQTVGIRAFVGKPQFAIPALVVVALLLAILGWYGWRSWRARWVEREALPEVARLTRQDLPFAALRLLRRAEQYAPSSPELIRARARLSGLPVSIHTSPPGADVYILDYGDRGDRNPSRWELLGRSPFNTDRIPAGNYRVRAVKTGLEPVERLFEIGPEGGTTVELQLHTQAATPAGMVWVPGAGRAGFGKVLFPALPVEVPDFWIDRHEVTNRQFKEFVDAGGYQKREYWKQPFIKDNHVLSWEQAMSEFRDASGRPGPATWELGGYPEGKGDYPVGGVSWYEAAAYGEFAGKSLPTVYHWFRAAGLGMGSFVEVLEFSNFSRQGPAQVESYRGLGPFGTYDMAGNVKEWCSNRVGTYRYILGGGWNDPNYQLSFPDARNPIARAAHFGFRCAKYRSPVPGSLGEQVTFVARDRRRDKPADDRAFRVYRDLHSYDKTDLKAAVESFDETSPYWRREKVTFQAAYGKERVVVHLYLPKNARPPYQLVVFFPGSTALVAPTIEAYGAGFQPCQQIVRSGRALIFPAYKGTLERGPGAYYHWLGQPDRWREMNLQWSRDLGRSVDYLETRKDIDMGKVAYIGHSMGAAVGPRLVALEPRFKVAVLISGGTFEKVPPEVDSLNFAPRVRIPVLMLNGRDDFLFPLESSQLPLFRLLGTQEKDKKHVLYDGGHGIVGQLALVKDTLDWLDRYLGPVKTR